MTRPGGWRTLALTLAKNPISTFAVLCVMATGVFLGYTILKLLAVLSSPDFCSRALQAERITPGNTFVGLVACVDLLKLQVQAEANALLISMGGYNLVLVVLVVVVIAGARASGKVAATGIEFDVSRDDPDDATPVKVVNPPSAPVPTAEAPKPADTGKQMP
jgi:hypothetical protein